LVIADDPGFVIGHASAALAQRTVTTPLAILSIYPACSTGIGPNDTSGATPLPHGTICPRLLSPEFEAQFGSNITAAAASFASELNANATIQTMYELSQAAVDWNRMPIGPFLTDCGSGCGQGLRDIYLYQYVTDDPTLSGDGTGVRKYIGFGSSQRGSCGAPLQELATD